MASLPERILALLQKEDSLSDREITDRLFPRGSPQQPVNIACPNLAANGRLIREKRNDGRIENRRLGTAGPDPSPALSGAASDIYSEDEIKRAIEKHLHADGWTTKIAWARTQGTDIEANRGPERWIIEVKGEGSLSPMRVNYFLAILGELLQRMNDDTAKYSIALPDVAQFRGLWDRLPALAKKRTQISALFVGRNGAVTEH